MPRRGAAAKAGLSARVRTLAMGVMGAVLALVAVLLLRTATFPGPDELRGWGRTEASRIPAKFTKAELTAMKEALKEAIQIPTVAFTSDNINTTALLEFGEHLQKVFPSMFSTSFIQHEIVGEYSHLFTIRGSDPKLEPYMLLAHIDVVPASDDGWEVPPFSGLERDGFIYGRGTLDNKNSVMAILQAMELLLRRNYVPQRSFYISLGHDEEVSGKHGAKKIAALLESRGVRLSFIIDEGGSIRDGFLPGVEKPFALISVSEKGGMNLRLQVESAPGHSSAPPKETSIGILAAAVSRLEQTPMPNMFGYGTEKSMLEQLAGQFGFPLNVILTNLWIFGPIVSRVLEKSPITNAMLRTTAAVTMFNAGIKINVIPPTAQAIVNLRIHPGQTISEVLEMIQNILADDRVQYQVLYAFNPLPLSPYDHEAFGYQLLRRTIKDVFPEVSVVVPGICIGNTDVRHYANISTGLYRFNPVSLSEESFKSVHGLNERISIQAYENQVTFLFELIQNADTEKVPKPHSAVHEL
ncbi:N-fatty-acyl-amino acid synthase/hydrolase PM20D1-like [Trichosurus vulpecula]|uniref:N-fatty-acyl-amino acid synthase/hydrolase PM20D1-like n=1 Tax=Trichosurus vulpecula TaxID=9337 RepID=UPI00186AC7E9|nr:N-fatty-acyl-amino acid synthase/hydrolase PM20D1-like [Trichosurus vulpecula]